MTDKNSTFFNGQAFELDRRRFLAATSAAGAGAAAASLLPKGAFASGPNAGGHLKIGSSGGSTTDSLDPAKLEVPMAQVTTYTVRNALVEINAQGQATPELAESWEAKPGAAEWVFKLRKGVEFHNGKTLDAEDVVYSINHHRGENSQSGAKAVLNSVSDVRAEGKDTVVITLTQGNADLPYILSDYHLAIMPKDGNPEDGMGTGAYILEHFEPGVRALAKKNPNYWKSGRAHVDSVEVLSIADVSARTPALQTGDVHIINRLDPKTLSLMKRVKDVQILATSGTFHYTMPMMADRAPFNNPDLRLALKYAIDREQVLKTILRGYGRVGNDHPIAASDPYFASELPQRAYDPDKAAFHFKKAGLAGETIPLHASDAAFTGALDTAVLLKESASKAGVNIDIKREPADGYWSNVWMKAGFHMSSWLGRPTPDMMFSTAFKSDAAWNEGAWRSEAFDKMLLAARSELDHDKRKAIYAEMQTMVSNDGGVIVPVFADYLDAARANVQGMERIPTSELGGFRLAEQVWFA